ncbi:class I SAM-dependent methyltransferase [Fibrobacter sp. UWS1]|uniref:class I SAM-dependent methyltransferase n=1 Tax=Fibrobacter sp. UWS1 TaxID=1896220 RepID=UPI000BB0EE3F|nr:class I SAM-dependent methyltransferase [Fibrobacter sp. UWS1]PBC68998.1 methyltransferase family protein [Fibrobacter sp. UWS1]
MILEKLRHNPICIKIYSYLKWHERLTLIKNFGFKYKCPFCRYHARKLKPIGCDFKVIYEKEIIGCGRRFAGCIKCGSTDKERLVFTYLKNNIDFFSNTNKTILHMAPEPNLSKQFLAHKFKEYICGDYFAPGYENAYPSYVQNINILNIPYSNEYFDVVICNHVLEHVEDDLKGMSEIYRVLRKGGFAILQVPISYVTDKTYEDPSISDPAEREKVFGQRDHVRIYGLDYFDRLKKIGFEIEVVSDLATRYSKYGLNGKEKIFVCHK